ncbi:hypothetical protein Tco_1437257 [Tanacetum coccineum]
MRRFSSSSSFLLLLNLDGEWWSDIFESFGSSTSFPYDLLFLLVMVSCSDRILEGIANHWSGVEDQLLVWVFLRKEILLAGSFLTPFFEVWGMHQLSEMEETFMEGVSLGGYGVSV